MTARGQCQHMAAHGTRPMPAHDSTRHKASYSTRHNRAIDSTCQHKAIDSSQPAEKGNVLEDTYTSKLRKRVIVSEASIATVSTTTLGKLLRHVLKCI